MTTHDNGGYVNLGTTLIPPGRRVVAPYPPTNELRRMESMESSTAETGNVTGTKDKDYNIIWFTEACLSNALRLESYIQDAERENDSELADFFRKAQHESQKGAEQGKAMLKSRL